MGDGANIGVTAGRALNTILGGDDQPTEEEQATPEQVRERIMAAPDPMSGKPIFERKDEVEDAYTLAADAITKAMLLCEKDDPGLLAREAEPHTYPDDYSVPELRGKTFPTDNCDLAWDAIKSHWPDFDDWIGGATGFMVGFAYNTARYINKIPPTPNPALLTIGTGGEDESSG